MSCHATRNTRKPWRRAVPLVIVVCALAAPPSGCVRPVQNDVDGTLTYLMASEVVRESSALAAQAAPPEVEPAKPPLDGRVVARAAFEASQAAVLAADRAALETEGVDCVQYVRARGGTIRRVDDFRPERARRARERCTVDDPVVFGGAVGSVRFRHDEMLMGCALARSLVGFVDVLEEHGITEVYAGQPYQCRTIRRRRTLSQHAHGLAIDIGSLTDVKGNVYDVGDDWEHRTEEPQTQAGRVLRAVVYEAFERGLFNIILTPDYDRAHERWLHLDLSPGNSFIR